MCLPPRTHPATKLECGFSRPHLGLLLAGMIVRPHASAIELLVTMRGSIVPAILPQVFFAALLGVAAAFARSLPDSSAWTSYNFTPFTALGVAISLFLGFRNNACYER